MRELIVSFALFASMICALPMSSINGVNRYSYGANIGWMNWVGDTNNGAVIGEFVCSGYIHAANVGWIHLGSGEPANGVRYRNDSGTDYGVNHDGAGNLSGLAYGANVGWIAFTNGTGAGPLAFDDWPKVDLSSGKLSGYAYSANCGWISLSNTIAHVQTDTVPMGADIDGDGIADGWELTYTNVLTAFDALSDTDGDGVSDASEYIADTSPIDPAEYLRLLQITHGNFAPTYVTLSWTSEQTRFYAVQNRSTLDSGAWVDFFVIPFAGVGAVGFDDLSNRKFYRIRAFRPLAP